MCLVYTKTVDSVFRALNVIGYSTSGYPVFSRLSKFPPLATATLVNICYLFIYYNYNYYYYLYGHLALLRTVFFVPW